MMLEFSQILKIMIEKHVSSLPTYTGAKAKTTSIYQNILNLKLINDSHNYILLF